MSDESFAPGARVIIRNEEWLVRRVDRTSFGAQALSVVGLSPLVSGQEKIFLTSLDKKIEIVDPVNTQFVCDESPYYRQSRLFIESLLRQTPPTDEALYVGQKAAIDLVPYQLDPAIQALREPRQRILIADAVGLGKTIECGILLSELIKRGKGKRILVLTVKSMLTQFQKELWARFSIPLVRLDSLGIQRVRNRIPANHNPLYYYDKAIISIDTLKQEAEYRTFLENGYWDIIVIDEAHNVAERSSHSKRAKLAKLISSRSDSLIMLSATPHDGRRQSFASLMEMLNPTAIANPEKYGPEDIKGLFIRRFKKDVKNQISKAFPERVVYKESVPAGNAEENAYDILISMRFAKQEANRTGSLLFKTTLEKALFSSPAACRETIQNRISVLSRKNDDIAARDVAQLQELDNALGAIDKKVMSKYQHLLKLLLPRKGTMKWDPRDTRDRVVIFTERIETMRFLSDNLQQDLGLAENQIATLYGGMSDVDIQETVEQFGTESSKIRLLVCSDVASEGINLHYFSHRMIHFDIPWSLMVFQQRNGRIDRYGQQVRPEIYYLCVNSRNEKIRGDNRILELLIEKDKEVQESIGDPSEFTSCYTVEDETAQVGSAMEKGITPETFEEQLAASEDPLAFLLGENEVPTGETAMAETRTMPTIFDSDFRYVQEALHYIQQQSNGQIQFDVQGRGKTISITPTEEMRYRLKFLPPEVLPESGQIHLSADPARIEKEINRCRESENSWPEIQLLWEQHPMLEYLNDKVLASFSRQQAPVMEMGEDLPEGECVFLVYAVIPNRKSQPVLYSWYGVHYRNGNYVSIQPIRYWIEKLALSRNDRPNPQHPVDQAYYRKLVHDVVERTRKAILTERQDWENKYNPKLDEHLSELEKLRGAHIQQLEFDFSERVMGARTRDEKAQKERSIQKLFDDYWTWIEDTMTTEKKPYIRIAAVLKGGY